MVNFTISTGNLIVKICYVLCLAVVVIFGIGSMFATSFWVGLGVIVLGIPLSIMSFYMLFIFIDIHRQLVKLNEKSNSSH